MPGKQGMGSDKVSPEKKREIASKGGKRVHELGVGHKWTTEEASEAGKVGGKISKRKKKGKSHKRAT
ncbi:MAG TPA: general stress protein [Ktedonobacteraceae bacterium]|jgi:hypothetical protein|nr:general stress protein [Ktedonobacteraceae bacterium]